MAAAFIHSLADVQCSAIGEDSRVWQYSVVLPGARIGARVNICSHCFIENDVVVGNDVTIKNGVQLWDGLRLADSVFVGPNVSFTNDRFPRSREYPQTFAETVVERGASIGANATILPGVTIGEYAMIGAGAVVTRSVPASAIVIGNPAMIVGYSSSGHGARGVGVAPNGEPRPMEETRVGGVTLHNMPLVADIRGKLTVGEVDRDLPFTPARYFMVFDVPSRETRGEHAHRTCHQFLICVRGSCLAVADDGTVRQEFLLDRCDRGLHMPPMIWGTQYQYSSDAVLLVLASHRYDPSDYIREYDAFLAEIRARNGQ